MMISFMRNYFTLKNFLNTSKIIDRRRGGLIMLEIMILLSFSIWSHGTIAIINMFDKVYNFGQFTHVLWFVPAIAIMIALIKMVTISTKG